jgi:biotin carboxyl carrier protein
MTFHLRTADGTTLSIDVRGQGQLWSVEDETGRRDVQLLEQDRDRFVFLLDGVVHRVHARLTEREVRVVLDGRESVFARQAPAAASHGAHAAEAHEPVLRAPVPGRVVRLCVAPGDAVQAGDPLLFIEAMKMETPVVAPATGTVAAVHVATGDLVDQDQELVTCTY